MYSLTYNRINGTVNGIRKASTGAVIPLDIDNSDYQEFLTWNVQQVIPLDLNSISQDILDQNAARAAAQAAKAQAFIDNLPSWAVVGGKFDTMLADATAATNLAQAKAVLIKLITFLKKSHRAIYWDIKNTEE